MAVVLMAVASGAFAEGDWFRDAGYGLFVHWGPYAVPAKGEWYLNKSQMDPAEYAKFADDFTAERFDAKDWAAKAKRLGEGELRQPNGRSEGRRSGRGGEKRWRWTTELFGFSSCDGRRRNG